MHLQRNATQRNAYHNYILNNNFKFYIFQFFRAFSFLSVSFLSFVKEKQILRSFFVEKKNQKTTTFFVKKSGQKNNYNRITKSIRKKFFTLCGKFINLFDAFNFEIISRNENYAFDYNKYFCRNGNNRIEKSISHSPKASYGTMATPATKSGSRQVIQSIWIATPTSRLAMTSLMGTIYFLAMIMAESLFLVLGIILISAFYLIEKLKNKI